MHGTVPMVIGPTSAIPSMIMTIGEKRKVHCAKARRKNGMNIEPDLGNSTVDYS